MVGGYWYINHGDRGNAVGGMPRGAKLRGQFEQAGGMYAASQRLQNGRSQIAQANIRELLMF
jgi:hypothetical protein